MPERNPKPPSATTHDPSLTAASAPSRSCADLLLWAVSLAHQRGLFPSYGFHWMVWAHDPGCPLHPDATESSVLRRCLCQPDATLVIDIGLVTERRIPLIRDGVPLHAGRAH